MAVVKSRIRFYTFSLLNVDTGKVECDRSIKHRKIFLADPYDLMLKANDGNSSV